MKILHLVFRDHWSMHRGWTDKEVVESNMKHIPLVSAVGFLLKEDEHVYCLASNVASDGDIGIAMNVLKSTVVYKKVLNSGGKK